MSYLALLRAHSRLRSVLPLCLPLASTAAVIALTSFTAPAKALTFNWQFNNTNGRPVGGGVVTGTISGLLDNTPNQITGLTVGVTSTPNTPPGGWLTDWTYDRGSGFSVANGVITAYNVNFVNSGGEQLFLGNNNYPDFFPEVVNATGSYDNVDYISTNSVTFTPQAAAVPGPLPILGAASALGWSRRVRSRLRNAQRSAR